MRTNWRVAMAFLIAALALGWNIQNTGIASGFIDSVNRLGAQDEALYTREAIHMATRGNWLTPTFLGRYVLFKPPLLMWLSAASIKLFGISALPIRLPALLAGALICAIVFKLAANARSPWTGAAAAILLISNQLFHALARLNMTDIVLAACVAVAFASFLSDTTLRTRAAFWGFSIGVAAAIMTKSIAGLLPVAAVLLFCGASAVGRPTKRCLLQSAFAIAALALPWHLYQLIAHHQWFVTEYFGIQLITFGKTPPQTSQENQVLFYLRRLAFGDPVLTFVAITSIPAFFTALRKRMEPLPTLLLCWIVVFGAALALFQYRSAQYLVPLLPALAVASGRYTPIFTSKRAWLAVALLFAAFALKISQPEKPWGLSFASGNTLTAAQPLSNYCEKRRPADLLVFLVPDEFYSAVLPLPRVRYAWLDPDDRTPTLNPYLHYLGITLTPAEFQNLDRDRHTYAERLLDWKLNSAEPIGTALYARTPDELRPVILSHPHSDFFVARYLLNGIEGEVGATHQIVDAPDGRAFVLAHQPSSETTVDTPGWPCRL